MDEHRAVCGSCARPCGCRSGGDAGQPRASITQSLMMNSAAKQHRMNDHLGETNYESMARTNRTIVNQRQEEGDGAQFT